MVGGVVFAAAVVGWGCFAASPSGVQVQVGLFCSNNLCQAIRWSMPILYTADTGTYRLEERRDGAVYVSIGLSLSFCAVLFIVLLRQCYVSMSSASYNMCTLGMHGIYCTQLTSVKYMPYIPHVMTITCIHVEHLIRI